MKSCFPPPLLDDEPAGTASRLVGLKKAGASLPVQAKNVHIFPRKTVGKDGETISYPLSVHQALCKRLI